MAAELFALNVDAREPQLLARFWAGILGREVVDGDTLPPVEDTGFQLRFQPRDDPKTRLNRMHFDLTSESLEDQERKVARALELGGRHMDVGQRGDEGHVVLADPEGNEFDVIEPGNNFLAGCGLIGAVASDGSQQVGYFWAAALGWPLVWDQDEETAIQHPGGGTKITWGGPPQAEKIGRNRLRWQLTGADPDHLISLGATRLDEAGAWLDPDGNEFSA